MKNCTRTNIAPYSRTSPSLTNPPPSGTHDLIWVTAPHNPRDCNSSLLKFDREFGNNIALKTVWAKVYQISTYTCMFSRKLLIPSPRDSVFCVPSPLLYDVLSPSPHGDPVAPVVVQISNVDGHLSLYENCLVMLVLGLECLI